MRDTIGSRLRSLRDDSTDEIAAAVGMSKSHLWSLEQDRVARSSVICVGKLAHGKTIDRIVEGSRPRR